MKKIHPADPAHNIWIFASAGSGKTKLLVDRVIRLILSDANLAKILCITFTKNASTEMQERVYARLEYFAICSDEQLITALAELELEADIATKNKARLAFANLLNSQDEFKIQTIHSFCHSLIISFQDELEIQASSRIIDDAEKNYLIRAAIKLFYSLNVENFSSELVEFINNQNENSLYEIAKEIFANRLATIDQQHDQASLIEKIYNFHAIKIGYNQTDLDADFYGKIQKIIEFHNQKIERLKENSPEQIVKFFSALEQLNKEAIINMVLTKEHTVRKNILPKKIVEQFCLEDFLNEISLITHWYIETEKSIKTIKQTLAIAELKNYLLLNYKQLKLEAQAIDYDDIIIEAIKLLSNPDLKDWVAYRLGNKFEHILVDESQDTNILQWQIINLLVAEFLDENSKTIFVVGDEKQSIYSFQGASPILFNSINSYFRKNFTLHNRSFYDVNLNISYRSSPTILGFIDDVFSHVIAEFPTSVFNYQPHNAHNNGLAGKVQIYPLVSIIKQKEEAKTKEPGWDVNWEYNNEQNIKTELAKLVVEKIKYLIDSKIASPGEILILFRKRDELFPLITKFALERNIDIAGSDRLKLSEEIAFDDLLALVKFIVLPIDDLNLACLLKSPIFELDDKDLEILCIGRKDKPLWLVLEENSANYQQAYNLLKFLLENRSLHNPYDLFHFIIEKLGYRSKFIARLGSDVNLVLDEMLKLANSWENSARIGLGKFAEYLESTDYEISRPEALGADQVRMMTVHGSKGLESKIVILPDCNSVPVYDKYLINHDGIDYCASSVSLASAQYKSLRNKAQKNMMDEYFRLLYVALTRAKQKVIVMGHSKGGKIIKDSWYEKLYNIAKEKFTKTAISRAIFHENLLGLFTSKELLETGELQLISKESSNVDLNSEGQDQALQNFEFLEPDLQQNSVPNSEINIFEYENYLKTKQGVVFHKLMQHLLVSGLLTQLIPKPILNDAYEFHNSRLCSPIPSCSSGSVLNPYVLFKMGNGITYSHFSDLVKIHAQKESIDISNEIISSVYSFIKSSAFNDIINAADIINLMPEQQIVYNENGQKKFVRLDLLICKKNEIILVEYKTSKHSKHQHEEQIKHYANILKSIYPGKKISAYLCLIIEGSINKII